MGVSVGVGVVGVGVMSVGVSVGANLEKFSFSHSMFFCLSFLLLYVIY